MRAVFKFILTLALLLGCYTSTALSQEQSLVQSMVEGNLAEVRNQGRICLIVTRRLPIDTREPARPILEAAYKNSRGSGRLYLIAHNSIARKLNKYMNKYRSITAVEQPADADFIVLFNILAYRAFDRVIYPYGEMFVIKNETAEGKRPRIIWRQRKELLWSEDAAGELIKELRAMRGEK